MVTDVVKNIGSQTSIARNRRKLILKAKRDYRNGIRSNNLTSHLELNFTSSATYETTVKTAMARKRRKIILDNRKRLRNFINTEVGECANANSRCKNSNYGVEFSNNIVIQNQNMDHASTSNHNMSIESHYQDNDDSNSDNNLNSPNSSDSEEDSVPAQLQEARLQETGKPPQYAQLYIYDMDNEVEHRIKCFKDNKGIERPVVNKLKIMLDEHNVHAKAFRMARDVLRTNSFTDLKLILISDRSEDGRVYNKPTVSEVAALIVGDIDYADKRDILIHRRNGGLQRIDEFHPTYLAYQYPLIFPYGEDGYRKNIMHKYPHETEVTRKNRQSIKGLVFLPVTTTSQRDKNTTLLKTSISTILSRRLCYDGIQTTELVEG
ncbi:uncharacterized protein LOC131632902 [Vicia villosa]|uniref:uncharacterized protein LOC131632902 n=1 Tax=Vicia villosa TaxID=3911 RepID=UPI00273B0C28|nr:uncharacterized protein LOC131632902 [Vicia villosa]